MSGFFRQRWTQVQPILRRYFWIFVGFSVAQVGVQVLNFFTGFAIIRNLTKEQYALYTIINTLVPTMLILSDNGIGNGIMALGRRFWQDDEKLGSLVNTSLRLRRKFAVYSMLVVAPLLIGMLFHLGSTFLTVTLLVIAVLAGIFSQLTSSILRMVLELRQQVTALGKVNFASAALRLGLVMGIIAFYHLNAFLATVAATCTFLLEASFLVRSVKSQVKWNAPPKSEYASDLMILVKQTLPLSIYFCVQGQVSIWLISVFGSVHQVADIGAAMRLGVLYTTLTSAFCILMLPRFARANGRRELHRQVYEVLGPLALVLACLITFAAIFPQPFVFLLGDRYTNMAGLFWLVIFSAGYSSLVGIVFTLSMSKGWVPPAYLTIPVEMISQIILVFILDLSKTVDVLVFALLSGLAPGIFLFILLLRRIAREPEFA